MATLVQENGINKSAHVMAGPMLSDHQYCEKSTNDPTDLTMEATAVDDQPPADDEETPEIDIMINNVVCTFSVKCHLNLRQIALNGKNVEFRRENAMVTMKLRRPYTTASIWSSGRITCTGATSENQAKIAARKYARALQNLGFEVRFRNYRVVNVLGTCRMPFGIKIIAFSEKYKEADYEPELHPGVTYKFDSPKATLKIFATGGVTITARSVNDVQSAVERIFPLVYEFRKPRTAADEDLARRRAARQPQNRPQMAAQHASVQGRGKLGDKPQLFAVSDDEAEADDWD